MISTHSAGEEMDIAGRAGALGACNPIAAATRLPRVRDSMAIPSMVTRSNGGWSRSAWTVSRSTAPAQSSNGFSRAGKSAHPLKNQGLGLGNFGHGARPF